MLPNIFICINSIIIYGWNRSKSSIQVISKRKRSHITWIVKLLRALSSAWLWMSYDFFISFKNFQKLLHNYLTLADTGPDKEHDNTSEDKFSVCYWNTEVCCNLLSASQKNWRWCTRSLYSEAVTSSLGQESHEGQLT